MFDVTTSLSLVGSLRGMEHLPPSGTRSLAILPEPSEHVPPDDVAQLHCLGVEVRKIPGAGHTVWYGHVDASRSSSIMRIQPEDRRPEDLTPRARWHTPGFRPIITEGDLSLPGQLVESSEQVRRRGIGDAFEVLVLDLAVGFGVGKLGFAAVPHPKIDLGRGSSQGDPDRPLRTVPRRVVDLDLEPVRRHPEAPG